MVVVRYTSTYNAVTYSISVTVTNLDNGLVTAHHRFGSQERRGEVVLSGVQTCDRLYMDSEPDLSAPELTPEDLLRIDDP